MNDNDHWFWGPLVGYLFWATVYVLLYGPYVVIAVGLVAIGYFLGGMR